MPSTKKLMVYTTSDRTLLFSEKCCSLWAAKGCSIQTLTQRCSSSIDPIFSVLMRVGMKNIHVNFCCNKSSIKNLPCFTQHLIAPCCSEKNVVA